MNEKEFEDFDFQNFNESTNGQESSSESDEGEISPEKLGYSTIANFSDEEEDENTQTTISTTIEEVEFDIKIPEDLSNSNSNNLTTNNTKDEEEMRKTSMREFEERYKRDIKVHIENVDTLKRGKDFQLNSDSVSTIKDIMKGFTLANVPEWVEPKQRSSNSNENTVEWLSKVAEDLKAKKSKK